MMDGDARVALELALDRLLPHLVGLLPVRVLGLLLHELGGDLLELDRDLVELGLLLLVGHCGCKHR